MFGAARLRVAWCSALTRNNDLSCKRHQFPSVGPDHAAQTKRLWQANACMAPTVLTAIDPLYESRRSTDVTASLRTWTTPLTAIAAVVTRPMSAIVLTVPVKVTTPSLTVIPMPGGSTSIALAATLVM